MTWRAIGAAVTPPVRVWPSSTTATAIRGGEPSFGPAKQMNHVVFRPVTPVSAVPVLPATVKPEIAAAVPVPRWTTPLARCRWRPSAERHAPSWGTRR